MFAKRGRKGIRNIVYLLFVVIFMLVSLSFVSAQTGRECTAGAYSILTHCGGRSIFTPGYGGVELCQVCFQCGLSGINDGVCPEDYSDGVFETSPEKLIMNMRVARPVFSGDVYSVAFNTGVAACAEIGGNCNYTQRSTNGISWNPVPGAGNCSLDISLDNGGDHNAYYRAICKDVPRTAGCENCPDPDCKAVITGKAYKLVDDTPLNGITISFGQSGNTNLLSVSNVSDFNGNLELAAPTGYLDITCSHVDYLDYNIRQYIKRGRNIVDCKMSERWVNCTPECYYVDSGGNRICSAICDGKNGCNMTDLAKVECEGKPYLYKAYLNDTTFLNATDNCTYENVTFLNCCKGALSSDILSVFAPGGCTLSFPPIPINNSGLINEGNLSNMLTRNYKKELNGRSITLSIRTYIK